MASTPDSDDRPALAVAYSGGRDSTALLHATLAAADQLGLRVVAMHVHHGLSANADAWLAHCRTQCERWAAAGAPLEFKSQCVAIDPAGQGIEAAARSARYVALAEMARDAGCDLVLLAHHRDDQAETVLLQALRGAGMAGLAAMPTLIERDGIHWARPWLQRPRSEIDGYISRHVLAHIDDDSNTDPRFARNRLRHVVWPAFSAAFPQASQALSSVAAHAQEAAVCLSDLAAIDLDGVRRGQSLSRSGLLALAPPRRANALRHWLAGMAGGPAPTTLLHRLIAELEQDRPARWPVDEVRELRLYRDDITLAELPAPQVCSNPSDLQAATALCIDAPGSYRIGSWLGLLLVEPADAGANGVVALASLAHLQARPRHGGEHFQRAVNMPARSLKKQYQAAGVPAWQRHGPLLWSDGRLLFAPGLGVDAWWHLRHGDSIAGSCCRLFWIARNSHSDADVNEQLAP